MTSKGIACLLWGLVAASAACESKKDDTGRPAKDEAPATKPVAPSKAETRMGAAGPEVRAKLEELIKTKWPGGTRNDPTAGPSVFAACDAALGQGGSPPSVKGVYLTSTKRHLADVAAHIHLPVKGVVEEAGLELTLVEANGAWTCDPAQSKVTNARDPLQAAPNLGVDPCAAFEQACRASSEDEAFNTAKGKDLWALVEKNPSHPKAKDAVEKLLASRVGDYVASLDDKVGAPKLTDRATFEAAANDLKKLVEACPSCASAPRAKYKIEFLEATLKSWPKEVVASLDVLMLKYGDLRGKIVGVWPQAQYGSPEDGSFEVAADDYYNCTFKSQGRYRSFKISASKPFHLYCKKGDVSCERLFEAATSKAQRIYNVRVRYPSSNQVCEGSQAELLSFAFPGQWMKADADAKE